MGLILNIETSSPVCSVCLAKDGALISYKESRENNSHARLLTVLIDELMLENNIAFHEIDAIAVSAGPGSYTGLRIGIAAAKGLCYALDKPLISVPTLLALSQGIFKKIQNPDAHYMPALDARKMDIYTAIYDQMGKIFLNTTWATIDEELEMMISAIGEIYIGGSGADKFKNKFNSGMIHVVEDINCDSRWMINISDAKYYRAEFERTAYFEPFYLKEYLPGIKKIM